MSSLKTPRPQASGLCLESIRVRTNHSSAWPAVMLGSAACVEEATEDAGRRAVDFAVARTSLGREEAYMLPSIIGELARWHLAALSHGDTADGPRGAIMRGRSERRAGLILVSAGSIARVARPHSAAAG